MLRAGHSCHGLGRRSCRSRQSRRREIEMANPAAVFWWCITVPDRPTSVWVSSANPSASRSSIDRSNDVVRRDPAQDARRRATAEYRSARRTVLVPSGSVADRQEPSRPSGSLHACRPGSPPDPRRAASRPSRRRSGGRVACRRQSDQTSPTQQPATPRSGPGRRHDLGPEALEPVPVRASADKSVADSTLMPPVEQSLLGPFLAGAGAPDARHWCGSRLLAALILTLGAAPTVSVSLPLPHPHPRHQSCPKCFPWRHYRPPPPSRAPSAGSACVRPTPVHPPSPLAGLRPHTSARPPVDTQLTASLITLSLARRHPLISQSGCSPAEAAVTASAPAPTQRPCRPGSPC